MKKLSVFLILLIIANNSFSQEYIVGRVLDMNTKEPLAFANVIFNNNHILGARSDIDGKFSFKCPENVKSLTCSYIGYKSLTLLTDTVSEINNIIVIALEPLTTELQEVVVKPGENPADLIIRKVIENKDSNNPEKISSFKYTSYNKTIYDFLFNDINRKDSINIMKKMEGGHLLIMESVTERRFISPDISEENVIGSKVSGFKNPSFVSLATDLQPFSFYYDNIKLFDINYLNPISKGSLNNYNFHLNDTLYQNNDTIYAITFKPKRGKNFDGLTGILYISTNNYAIQNVIASPFAVGKIDLKIQQQYRFTGNKYWFPEQLNYALTIREYPTKEIGMTANGKSYIYNTEFNVPLDKRDFSYEAVKIDMQATRRDSLFWKSYRPHELNFREVTTYRVVDSIGEKRKFETLVLWLEKLSQNRIPVKFFDIDLPQTLVYNKFEGNRPGLGVYTNEKVFRNLVLGGFFGYGMKDEKWKYGGEIKYDLSKEHGLNISFKYQDNLQEAGSYGMDLMNNNGYSLRRYMGFRMDRIQQKGLVVGVRLFKYANLKVALNNFKTSPKYNYLFQNNNQNISNYINSELSVNIKIAYKERIVNSLNHDISMGTKYPTFYFLYSRGLKGLWGSNLDYNKYEARIEQSFYTRKVGTTKYRFDCGYIDTTLPYGLLFTGEGSQDRSYPINVLNTFQTMNPYEFLSDRYTNLFLSHNFGSLLFHIKNFRPDITLHNNIGWGDLSNSGKHQFVDYKTKEKVYCESGIQFDNVIKINYLNLGYIGFGAAVFYRYGYYSYPDFRDDLALKLTMTYTIR